MKTKLIKETYCSFSELTKELQEQEIQHFLEHDCNNWWEDEIINFIYDLKEIGIELDKNKLETNDDYLYAIQIKNISVPRLMRHLNEEEKHKNAIITWTNDDWEIEPQRYKGERDFLDYRESFAKEDELTEVLKETTHQSDEQCMILCIRSIKDFLDQRMEKFNRDFRASQDYYSSDEYAIEMLNDSDREFLLTTEVVEEAEVPNAKLL